MVRFGRFDKAETKPERCGLPQIPGTFCQCQGVISVAILTTIIIAPTTGELEACLFVKAKSMISFADFKMQADSATPGGLVFEMLQKNSADPLPLSRRLYCKQQ